MHQCQLFPVLRAAVQAISAHRAINAVERADKAATQSMQLTPNKSIKQWERH